MCIGTSWQDRTIKEGYGVSSEMEGACGLPAWAAGPAQGPGAGLEPAMASGLAPPSLFF